MKRVSADTLAGRPAEEILTSVRARVGPALRSAVDGLPAQLRHVAGYHFGWWDDHGRPVEAGGKALRPALVLLAAEAVGGSCEDAIMPAAAVELVHNSTLLHDDVIDGDGERRHRPAAWRVFGSADAILAGDALITEAIQLIATGGDRLSRRATRLLGQAAQEVMGGQCADVEFERRDNVEISEVVAMARAKTGALVRVSCELGALYGGGEPERIARLAAFGAAMGLAYQHVDDLLGIWGDPVVTGKPAHSDLHSRKKSLPVVAALTSGSAAGRELAALYRGAGPLTEEEAARAAELVERAGGRQWSQAQADELIARARDHLAEARPSPRAAAELDTLARLITRRDR